MKFSAIPASEQKGWLAPCEGQPEVVRNRGAFYLSTHGDLTSLAPHERLPEILVVPREKTPTGAAARGNP